MAAAAVAVLDCNVVFCLFWQQMEAGSVLVATFPQCGHVILEERAVRGFKKDLASSITRFLHGEEGPMDVAIAEDMHIMCLIGQW